MINVEALKNTVLDLAMHGKLVPQDPNDEPASVLLERIKAEKAQLIKEKKIRKPDPLPPIEADEIPYEIPDSWEWVRLDEISMKIIDGSHNPPEKSKNGFPMLSARNIKDGKIDFSLPHRLISEKAFEKEDLRTKIRKGNVLLTTVGSIGNSVVVQSEIKFTVQRSVSVIDTYINSFFLMYYLKNPELKKRLLKNSRGTAQKGVYLNQLKSFVVALPPLNEQQRIADKIEEIFAELDKIDAASKKYDECKELLNKQVLNLAVHGKLVPQDSSDEPASVLFERIKAEKAQLIKEKKIKKSKPLPPIEADEIPYEIPDSWEWVRLGDIVLVKGGKRVPKGMNLQDSKTEYPYIRVSDMKNYFIDNSEIKYATKEIYEKIKNYYISSEDLYISIAGTIGKVGEIPDELDGSLLTENAVKIVRYSSINKKYMMFLIASPVIQKQFYKLANTVTQSKLSIRSINHTIVSLPPVQEQQRIVNKIEEIFAALKG